MDLINQKLHALLTAKASEQDGETQERGLSTVS